MGKVEREVLGMWRHGNGDRPFHSNKQTVRRNKHSGQYSAYPCRLQSQEGLEMARRGKGIERGADVASNKKDVAVMSVPSTALFCADCRDVLPTLAPDSIALSVWSPPYCVGKGYEAGVTYDEWANMLTDVLHLHARVLKPGGFCAVNIGDILCFADSDMPKIQAAKPRLALTRADVEAAQAAHPGAGRRELAAILGVSEQTVQRRLEHNNVRGGKQADQTRMKLTGEIIERPAYDAGLFLYDRRIWHKDPCWANSQWHTNSYRAVDEAEYVWILWRPGITPIRRDRLAPGEWAEWGSRGVWQIPSVRANDVHEAMFPVELPRRLIRLLTDECDTVLDPFMGSGTSGIAAVAAGRAFIGVDNDAAAVDVARRRISDTQNNMLSVSGERKETNEQH
jgi:DNA modification methylase